MDRKTSNQLKIKSKMLEWLGKLSRYLKLESDLRVDRWFLMSSSVPTLLICFSSLVVAKLLHVYMKPREALNIRWAIWCFNVFHMTVSFIFLTFCFKLVQNFNFRWVIQLWINMARQNFLFSCQHVDKLPDGVKTASLAWWYFIYNFTFFTEIFIFLLGKKHERITKYFVFHHIALPISIWWIVKVLLTLFQLEKAIITFCISVFPKWTLALLWLCQLLRSRHVIRILVTNWSFSQNQKAFPLLEDFFSIPSGEI